MKGKMKQRIIALLCVVCMLCTGIYVNEPLKVQASGSTATTVDGLLAEGFVPWTLSDVGIKDQTVTDSLCWGDGSWQKNAAGTSLDKTIFGAKFNFAAGSTSFGNIYIGGDIKDSSANAYRGFVLRGFDDDDPNLTFGFQGDGGIFYDKNGATNNQIAVFYKDDVGVELRGNDELEIAISVEYLDVVDELVTMQVGVFFNGQLFNGTYYTVKDVPEKYLTQSFRWYKPSGTNEIKSASLVDITLENAPERDFAEWTFSDVGIADASSFDNAIHWSEFTSGSETEGKALDKTIFHGKLKLDNEVANSGIFLIGGNYNTEASGNRGFRFERFETTDKIAFGFWGLNGVFYNENGNTGAGVVSEDSQIAILDPAVAGTDLLGNSNLEMSLSVEYISEETNGNVDIRVGLFFDEKLYDNTYFVVKGVPESFLRQNIRFKMGSATSGVSNAIASARIEDITLENAPEREFSEWSFDTVGIPDQNPLANNHWDYSTAKDVSLDESIFVGTIDFKDEYTTTSWSYFYIGGPSVQPDDTSKHRGFQFAPNGTDKLYFGFRTHSAKYLKADGTTVSAIDAGALAIFDSTTAGTTLRGNENLQVALSVEYVSEVTDGLVDIQVGVFFDGVLYDNTYYTLKSVPEELLRQSFRVNGATKAISIASDRLEDITLQNAAEKDFTYWTFRDIDWSDRSVAEDWGWTAPSNSTELKNSIFNGKINFPTESTDFRFYIGGATTGDTSKYRGFFFRGNSGDGKLNLSFQGTDEKWYTETGAYAGSDANAGPFLVMDSTTAGVDLRGNKDLQVSLSIEYGEPDSSGLVDVKVGVFFDGVLYNNEYCILPDVDPAYLTQNVRWLNGSSTSFAFSSLAKATNVAAAENGAMAYTSHVNVAAEYAGYGAETLIDGIAGQNDPHFKGASAEDLQNEPISVTVEFVDVYSVDHIRLYKYAKTGGFPSDFTIEALTEDGWKTVKTVSGYAAENGWNDFRFEDTICTAVRVMTITNGTTVEGYGLSFGELQAMGVPTLGDVEVPYKQAQEGVVLVAGAREEEANDGVFVGADGHRALTNSASDTVRIQTFFETAIDVQSIQIHAKEPGKFANSIQIYAFTGSTWQEIYSNTNYTYAATQTMHEFSISSPVTCTNIMVLASGISELYQSYGMQIHEMRVHGMRSDADIAIFGDTNEDGDITEAVELDELRQVLIGEHTADVHNDLNMDEITDIRDLVRMKRYLPLSEGVVRTYDLSCMTWNILGFGSDGYEDQATRAPYIAQEILAQDVDFIGVQEAGGEVYSTITEYEKTLCENGPYKSLKISDIKEYQDNCAYYKLYGYMPAQSGLIIYYKADRFVLQNSGAIQYSVGQPTLTGDVERWFMYAEFLDTESGETVYMTNTHWSANLNALEKEDFEAGATYHETQSKELMEYWQTKIGDGIMFATGDFNAYEDTEAIKYMNETGVYKEANLVLGTLGSIKEHIDHIFVNPDKMDVKNFNIKLPTYTTEDGTTYNYSDHPLYTTEVTYKN